MLFYETATIDWQAIDTVIHFIEVLVILIPSLTVFIHYRIQNVKMSVIEVKDSYATVMIHNRKNKSIFVKSIAVSADNQLADVVVEWDNSIIQLKPDEALSVKIKFDSNVNCHITATVVYSYNRDKAKKVEIK